MQAGRGLVAALLVGAALAGCTDVSTDPQVPVSLQFDTLPSLAVVVGDTLRGGDLLPARLPVRAFNGAGGAIPDTQLRVIGIDTASRRAFAMISGLRLVGTAEAPTVRIVAQAGSLQSQTQTFAVVPRPTGIRLGSAAVDSIIYDRPDTATRFRDIRVAVIRKVTDSAEVVLNGLPVRFRVTGFTTALLDSVRLVGVANGRDASGAVMSGGAATIRLKTYAKPSVVGRGTVTLEASTLAFGVPIPGSPIVITVNLVPFTLPR